MRKLKLVSIISIFILVMSLSPNNPAEAGKKDVPYKVYVMLGFHTSFYHSWRGDSNDEAGFGTDIRIVREILRMLNEANARGLDARGYWDIDVYFTLQEIIGVHAPDIIDGIKARVDAGLDEVLPAPYNNGITSTHTPEEMDIMFQWALKNPQGTGLEQVFGKVTPIFRPQESMTTPGIIPYMEKAGIKGIILPYSAHPFTSFSNFVHPLPLEQRYGVTYLKHETGPERTILLPCISPPDALNFGSPELLMRYLRKLQTSGKVKSDLLMHYNFDADSETWLPLELPFGLTGAPNAGGLMEFVDAVNKRDWAEFTTPAEYLKTHEPKGEVIIRQDTADGGFDGYFSWAEKFESHTTWTAIEQSRMYKQRALELIKGADDRLKVIVALLLKDASRDAFLSQSTTHFGMSTPIINEERQAVADRLSQNAKRAAYEAYYKAGKAKAQTGKADDESQYEFTLYDYDRGYGATGSTQMAVRIPVIIAEPGRPVLRDNRGNSIKSSLINIEKLLDGSYAAELTFIPGTLKKESRKYTLEIDEGDPTPGSATVLASGDLRLSSKNAHIDLSRRGIFTPGEGGLCRMIDPFITYKTKKKPIRYGVEKYIVENFDNEYLDGLQRAKLKAEIPFDTPEGEFTVTVEYVFSVYDDLPYIIVDVDVDYPYTPPRDLIATLQQKLRRLLDLRWVEVAPFQINPCFTAPESDPFTVWKHNYLGIVSSYDMDYGQINKKNREIDSFNHQVTNGWVAVINGERGLLIAEDASVNALFAFAPMRLRVEKGRQRLYINPFGTYFGRQLDYSHIHKSSVGTEMSLAVGAHLRPGGPSFNGKREQFRLMLAPYKGDKPSEQLQSDAMAFYYPYGVVFNKVPLEGIVTPEDIQEYINERKHSASMTIKAPLPVPGALLANPADGAIDLVWDIPRDERINGFDIRYRRSDENRWRIISIDKHRRYRLAELKDGVVYEFSVRSKFGEQTGEWAETAIGVPGPVENVDIRAVAGAVPVSVMLKLAKGIIKHMILIH